MEQPEIVYYTNNTPENPRNNDEEISYIDNQHPVGTSSPFKARLIINTQQQVTVSSKTINEIKHNGKPIHKYLGSRRHIFSEINSKIK